MKKIVVLMLALCLAVPAISYAGSATSRWDLSIGGTIKFDAGFADTNGDKNQNAAWTKAHDSNYNNGNFFMDGSESSLNFAIKGPDAWGAKTSAFLAGDFTGTWANATNQTYTMLIAKMQFDWPTTSIEIGVLPTFIGLTGTFGGNYLGYGNLNQFDKGFPNVPHIVWTQRYGKNFSTKFAVADFSGAPARKGAATSNNNEWTRSGYPGVEGALIYSSNACGKVGPWGLTAKLSGMYARAKKLGGYDSKGVYVDNPNDSSVDGYVADFTVIVPIIPERQGNKAGAMYVDAIVYQMQNAPGATAIAPAKSGVTTLGVFPGAYARDDGTWARPVITGYEGHLAYYFTNALFTNIFYGRTRAALSRDFIANNGAVRNNQNITVNLMYDVNPAVRLGVEWQNFNTRYTRPINAESDSNKGRGNIYRVGAFYFF